MENERKYFDNDGKLIMPTTLDEIDGTFVKHYCKEQGQAVTDWLKALYARPPKKDKNGKEREISFIEVRNEFAREYFKHLAPKGNSKKKDTIKNFLENL